MVTVAGFAVAALVIVTLSTAEAVALESRNGLPLASLIVVTLGVVRVLFVSVSVVARPTTVSVVSWKSQTRVPRLAFPSIRYIGRRVRFGAPQERTFRTGLVVDPRSNPVWNRRDLLILTVPRLSQSDARATHAAVEILSPGVRRRAIVLILAGRRVRDERHLTDCTRRRNTGENARVNIPASAAVRRGYRLREGHSGEKYEYA